MPPPTVIHDVLLVPLRRLPDARGMVMHMLRADAPHFKGFGELYFSHSYPGVIKAWKRHRLITQNLAVVHGMVQLVLIDQRADSPTCGTIQQIALGDYNYQLVQVPPLLLYGWRTLGTEPSLLANCATAPYDPTEVDSLPLSEPSVPFTW